MNDKVKECRSEITERMIQAMKEGTAPWQRPWNDAYAPQNAISRRRYSGVNALYLGLLGLVFFKSEDPRWLTFQQAKKQGWNVKKNEKGTRVIFWEYLKKPILDDGGDPVLDDDGNEKMKSIPFGKIYVVFHASQVAGIPPYTPVVHDFDPIEKAEQIIQDSGAVIRHGGTRAFYSVSSDIITVPPKGTFDSTYDYYATTLHELGHWTGHPSRLAREFGSKRSATYAREELVAEMASVFISAETAIPQTPAHFANHAAYVAHWINLLKSDGDALFRAARDASKAADYILRKENTSDADKDVA